MDDVTEIGGQSYVAATSSRLDDRTRTLKHGDSFAVFDRFGDIQAIGHGEQGIYHEDTRYLSRLELRLEDGRRPVFLNSTITEDNSLLTVDLTTPDIYHNGHLEVRQDTVHLFRTKLLWNDVCHEHLHLVNYGMTTARLAFVYEFDADFADIFEVRGAKRESTGQRLKTDITDHTIVLGYKGLDGITRQTYLMFHHDEAVLGIDRICFHATLAPHEEKHFFLSVSCNTRSRPHTIDTYSDVLQAAVCEIEEGRNSDCHVHTSNEQFNDWLNRSRADLHLLVSHTDKGPYPYAGVPWFSTPFGRDGIITALQYLWVNPDISRGVLGYLASTQATETNPDSDAEPGKILHETRKGEMANLGEVPFARYYGTVDATPLFLKLAGAYYTRTGDRAFIASIWPNIEAALRWIDEYGDKDGDGFIEYARMGSKGLVQQGWKDSNDSIFHHNGSTADGPIALCEVQGYVYDAWISTAMLADMRGDHGRAVQLLQKANRIKKRFNESFWCEEIGTYAIALDGHKMPCKVRSSNAGHVLFSGIATPAYAARTAATLLDNSLYSGWGVRTIAENEARFNPMSYHNGAVWPHDNAIVAMGLARYGFQDAAIKILSGLFDASLFLDLHRMPELFCGFARRPGGGPTSYPVACAPQAWASTVVYACLQASLGLSLSCTSQPRIEFMNPSMPPFLHQVEITNLRVGEASVDLLIRRHENDVGVIVLRRTGDVEVIVVK
jgi:glycogen debranching enzyme